MIAIGLRDEHKLHHHLLGSNSALQQTEVLVWVGELLEEVLTSLDVVHKRRRLLELVTWLDGGRRLHLPLVSVTWRPA